jgi:hypothetical protein
MDLLPCVDDDGEGIVGRGLAAATRDDAHQESYQDDSAYMESLSLAYANALLFSRMLKKSGQMIDSEAVSG